MPSRGKYAGGVGRTICHATEINQRIHAEFNRAGREQGRAFVQTLVPRQEMTGADRSWRSNTKLTTFCATRAVSRETGVIAKGEYTRVTGIDGKTSADGAARRDGSETTYDPRRQMGASVYREQEKAFSVGDRIQFTAASHELKIANANWVQWKTSRRTERCD